MTTVPTDTCAEKLATDMHGVFRTGKTRSYEWRLAQMQALRRMVIENDVAIKEALSLDLGEFFIRNAYVS